MSHKRRFGNDGDDSIRKIQVEDIPSNSRLFIVCGKSITEETFRKSFGAFGLIEEIWMVKDRGSGALKGVTYIKFSKTSEAAIAMEQMNGTCLDPSPRPLKVMIAHSKDQGSKRETNEKERLLRLFVVIPKTMTERELEATFSVFGSVEYVFIVRDKGTREPKGFAYIKYHKMSHAALAFEGCDSSYKAMFAEPRPRSDSSGETLSSSGSRTVSSATSSLGDMFSFMDSSSASETTKLQVYTNSFSTLTRDQLWRLFDLVPGLDYLEKGNAMFTVVYNNAQSAAYARDKLNGFEYPPGQRLSVRFEPLRHNDLAQLTETIANATALLQAAGYSSNTSRGDTYDPSYCSIKLPPPQPLAPTDSVVAERLFIVCKPTPPHIHALKDVFARFGSLIDVYLLHGKSCGYAKYSSKDSAQKTMAALHGQEICGSRLKVIPAEPHSNDPWERKRSKLHDE